MINLITGTPGAGKTYLSIKLLTEKYFFWHKKDKTFYRNEESKKYTIFTNINGFNLPHKNLDTIFKEQNLTFDQFFTPNYQKKIHEKYPHIIYVLDECQQFIPSGYRNKDVILYFDTHRHYGDKIWLITQDFKKIAIPINTLVELEYRAVKSTFSVFGEFRYNIKSNGQIFKRKTTKRDKRIFDTYTSFMGDNQETHSNPLKYIIVFLIVAFIGGVYFFYDMITPSEEEQAKVRNKYQPTSFSDEKKISTINTELSKPTDLKKIRALEILSKVIVKDQLYAFEDPITKKWIYSYENPYLIKTVGEKFYVIISIEKFLDVISDQELLTPS